MNGDYEANLELLEAARGDLRPLLHDEQLGVLAHYWSGFAAWRYAINSVNRRANLGGLETALREAFEHFDFALARDPEFADAHVGISGVAAWLLTFQGIDREEQQALARRVWNHLARAKEIEPANPRLAWVEGGVYLNAPAQYGGNRARALQLFETAIDSSAEPRPGDSLLPDWGVPESLMSLAWAHLNADSPDLERAMEYARRALDLRPNWYYVSQILIPRIESARNPGTKEEDMSQAQHDQRIDYIEIEATDIERAQAFYSSAFGWAFTDWGEHYQSFEDGRLQGGLSEVDAVRSGGPLVVIYAVDLEATRERIEIAGGRIVRETFSFPGGRRFHFADPSGNELAVWSDHPPES